MLRVDTLTFEPLVRTVAELLHDLAGFGAVLRDIGIVAGQGRQHLRRHPPQPFGRRQHRRADVALALLHDVDKGLAVEGQRHRPAQIGVVEGRLARG